MPSSVRRYDLDWLRIIAVFLLVPFHSALIFSLDPRDIVFIKDVVESQPLLSFASFLNLWHMPLLFVIAGASTWFALSRRTGGQYLLERVQRLLVPAVFGILLLNPLMTFAHFLRSADAPSYWSYYTGYFRINPDDLAGLGGTLTPAHLWFIVFLFVFSIVGLPLFLSWRKSAGSRFLSWFGRVFAKRGLLLVLFLPILLGGLVDILGDKNPIRYFLWFALGFLLISDERIQQAIARDLPLFAGLSLLATLVFYAILPFLSSGPLFDALFYFTRWVWVITILGIGQRWLNRPHSALPYLSEAAFPFYILHLPVNTLVGLWIIQLPLAIGLKYGLIVGLTTLLTWLIYEGLVRRVGAMRFLLGVKQRKPVPAQQPLVHPVLR